MLVRIVEVPPEHRRHAQHAKKIMRDRSALNLYWFSIPDPQHPGVSVQRRWHHRHILEIEGYSAAGRVTPGTPVHPAISSGGRVHFPSPLRLIAGEEGNRAAATPHRGAKTSRRSSQCRWTESRPQPEMSSAVAELPSPPLSGDASRCPEIPQSHLVNCLLTLTEVHGASLFRAPGPAFLHPATKSPSGTKDRYAPCR